MRDDKAREIAYKAGYRLGSSAMQHFIDGLKEGERRGARRERRALKRYLDTEPVSEATELRLWLRYVRPAQLKRAAKRTKRLEGK